MVLFVDDILLIASSHKTLQSLLQEICNPSKEFGLTICAGKTKWMPRRQHVSEWTPTASVQWDLYLGPEMKRRMRAAGLLLENRKTFLNNPRLPS